MSAEDFSDLGKCWLLLGNRVPFTHQVIMAEAVLGGYNVVLTAPTGSGKTEAAVIPILCKMIRDRPEPVSLLYITPLRALINDLLKRLKEIFNPHGLIVARKHGEVSLKERKERLKRVPHVLITTPESLEIDLDLSINIRKYLRNVKWVIIDELHELSISKRGLQLAILLERLRRMAGDFQVIALSATIPDPIKTFEPFLGSSKRPCKAIMGGRKRYSIKVTLTDKIQETLKEIIRYNSNEKLIVFVNSRSLAERIHKHLSDTVSAAVHHSSVSGSVKELIENKLKEGSINVVVATKTLELGIDVGKVDKVIHVGPPTSVISLLQRAGRSGHSLDRVSEAIILTDNELDYALALAIKLSTELEELESMPHMPCYLDVVAREVIGCALSKEGLSVDEIALIINSVKPCSNTDVKPIINLLIDKGLVKLINGKLSIGGYFYKLWSKEGAGGDIRRFFSLIMSNDDKFTVKAGEHEVGTLDMTYVIKYLRPWDRIRIGGRVWDVVNIDVIHKTVSVKPAQGEGEIPTWRGSLLSYSPLVTEVFYRCLLSMESSSICSDNVYREIRDSLDPKVLRQAASKQLFVESVNDFDILYGPFNHRFFELLGYVLSFMALSAGIGAVRMRLSPIGLAVESLGQILNSLRKTQLSPEEVIREAIKMSPSFQLKVRELLPTFATIKDELVINECIAQVMWEFDDGVGNVELIKKFIRGEIPIIRVKGPSRISLYILDSPPLRPWYGGSWHVIAEALKGMALTVNEVSEVTGLPANYIERKLKAMRKFKGRLRVVSFYDIFDGQIRWALAEELPTLAKGLFKDCFNMRSGGTYVVTIFSDRFDPGKSLLMRLDNESIERLLREIEGQEVFKVKVGTTYSSKSITYYHVPKEILPLIIRNAVTYLEGYGNCE